MTRQHGASLTIIALLCISIAGCKADSADSADAHFDAAMALNTKGDREGAIREFRAAISLRPDFGPAHHNLGNVLMDEGDLDAAMVEYRAAITIDAGAALSHRTLGLALERKGDCGAAIPEYRTALRLDPSDPTNVRSDLGSALVCSGKFEEAIDTLREGLTRRPDDPSLHVNLSYALQRIGDLDGARRESSAALRINPHFAPAHNALGNAFKAQGDIEAAIREYREAVRLDPTFPSPYANLGDMARRNGDLDVAAQEYARARRLDPNIFGPSNPLQSISAEIGPIDRALLLGHWRETGAPHPVDITFRADGTFSWSSTQGNDWHFAGDWELRQRILHYTYRESSRQGHKPGAKDRETIVAIGQDSYVIEDLRGQRYQFVRVD